MIEGNRSPAGHFTPGETLSAKALNHLAEYASRSLTTVNQGIKVTQGNFGTVYDISFDEAGTIAFDYPFRVSATQNGNQYIVQVRAGLANNFVPIMLGAQGGDKPMDAYPAPSLVFTTCPGPSKYVVLKVKSNPGSFFAKDPEVYLVDDLEAVIDTDTEGYLVLASISMIKEGTSLKGINRVFQYIYTCQTVMRIKAGASVPVFWNFTSR